MSARDQHTEVSRRGFLQGAAVAAGGLLGGASARAAAFGDVQHVVIDGGGETWCDQARQCGVKAFGDGELAVLYRRAPRGDEPDGGDVVLRRSLDGGRSWTPKGDVIVWEGSAPQEQLAAFLCQDPSGRPVLDMGRPEAMFFFGRTRIRLTQTVKDTKDGWTSRWTPSGEGGSTSAVFQLRSVDKGRTWERVPLVLDRPPRVKSVWKDNHPLVVMPDGALVGVVESPGALWLFGSECQGMTWQYLSSVAREAPAGGRPTCASLVGLAGARVQCYMEMAGRESGDLCLSESDDCFAWSDPRPIARGVEEPWTLRLRDGRIVVVFVRRGSHEAGLAAIWSADDGRTWSAPAEIRDEGAELRIAGPVAAELDDGRVFVAYGCQRGMERMVCGSLFGFR